MKSWARTVIANAAAAAALTISAMAGGCAGSQAKGPTTQPVTQRIFVPEAPAAPRLQFLTSFSRSDAFELTGAQPKKKSSLASFVAGDEDVEPSKVPTRLVNPYGIAAHNGVIYVCDVGGKQVHVVDVVRRQGRKLVAPVEFQNPVNIAIDEDGTKYLCDAGRRSILIFDAQDRYVGEIGDPQNCTPLDVVVHGEELFVADVVGGEIEVWTKRGEVLRKIGSKGMTADLLGEPTNLDIEGDLLFITDTRQLSVKVFTLDGRFQNVIGQAGATLGSFGRPKGVAVDPDMHVYVADALFDAIQVFRPDGQLLLKFGAPGDQPESVVMPAGLAIDTTSIPYFRPYLDPNFEPRYLLMVVNQFGLNKVAVWAFGRDKTLPESAYELRPLTTQPATQPATVPAPAAGVPQPPAS